MVSQNSIDIDVSLLQHALSGHARGALAEEEQMNDSR